MQKGNIGVTTENIFPVIKKFLYSDHEIFLRELVSNAVDATQKLKTLASMGDFKGELGDLTIHVTLGKDTITVSDRGLGLTADEIDKYINQIAFSGANDFLEKYKNDANAIIGHFGLGFYSAFMVAKKVEIRTKSYKDDAKAVLWSCQGSPEFTLEETEKSDRGTDIILYIDDDCKEFLEESRISALLNKYCRFLPVPVAFGKKKEWKEGKEIVTDEDNIINDTTPLWTKKPSELTDEDYKKFYRELYPMADEPLFWIHLNVDYPFHLTGILYFPKVKNNIELSKNKIQLYCNQVYVTDSVEGIVPDFLTLLHGVLDSPDIPLNVSRSYLQSDSNVKKISTYITKKVADRLQSIFKNNRKQFEEKWDDLKIFIDYGMLTQEDFYDRAKEFAYNVLLMNGQLDVAIVNLLEQKLEKCRFTRVDSDIIDNLIMKEDKRGEALDADKQEILSVLFKSQLPQIGKTEFHITAESLGENAFPILITQSEYMRRMKEMSNIQAGMGFYGEMPDMFNLILNSDHKLLKEILESESNECSDSIIPIQKELDETDNRCKTLRKAHEGKKAEEIPAGENDELNELDKRLTTLKQQKETILKEFASKNKVIRQLIDLALLQNGMLKGEALNNFLKRSIELINQ